MNPSSYNLQHLWLQSDVVIKSVALLLLIMSIASWYVILTKAIQLWQFNHTAKVASRAFWDNDDIENGLKTLGTNNPFSELAYAGVGAMQHHSLHQRHLHDQRSISDWITLSLHQTINESTTKLQSGIAILASVGSTAPFVGLFGTVWGIYHALLSLTANGSQSSIDKVSGPIGEALIMTALGLAVAIPATFGYNALVRGNKSVLAKLNKFSFDLHTLFVTGARVACTPPNLGRSSNPSAIDNLSS